MSRVIEEQDERLALAGERRALIAGIVGTTASVMPAFLTGAVAVQLGDDLGFGDGALGLCIGGFFTGAAVGSALLGRVAERLGGVRAMRVGLVLSLVVSLSLAALVQSTLTLGLLLVVGGTSNALTQPAANLLLVERMRTERMGFAFAIKQAGMPMASLVGGALVAAIAVNFGWRWTYVVAAAIAAVALFALPSANDGPPRAVQHRAADDPAGPADAAPNGSRRPDLPLSLLASYAIVGLLGAAAAGVLTAFLVSSAEDAGVAEGPAGLLLTLGSAVGIASRIIHGRLADRERLLPIRRVVALLVIGSAGLVVLAFHGAPTYVIGVLPVFGAGWAWPGLFNLSVVRNNPSAPAAATGVSQTGIYIGAAAGPFVGGQIAATWGYPALWLSAAGAMLGAAALGMHLRLRLRRSRA